jgi:hypothetical protein
MADRNAPRIVEVRFTLPLGRHAGRPWSRIVDDIDAWWPSDYRALPNSRMQLDPRPGGALLERGAGSDGLLWYTVQAVVSGQWMSLVGHIAPPWGGPSLSLLRLELRTEAGGNGEIEIVDSLVGRVDGPAVEAGWRAIFGACFS